MPSLSEKLHDLVERSELTGVVLEAHGTAAAMYAAHDALKGLTMLRRAGSWTEGGQLAEMARAASETPEAVRLFEYLSELDANASGRE
jgi:hypothetical protein